MKEKYLLAWMDNVERFAQTSEAQRLKVAAFLFKDGNIVSHAINGTPVGWPDNVCEDKIYADEEMFWLFDGSQEVDGNTFDKIFVQYPLEEDNQRRYRLVTKDCVVHAEEQCLQKMWHSHETTENTMMLTSHAPCLKCSLKMKSAGIQKVYYRHEYRSTEGVDYLRANNVEVEQI